MCAAKTITRPGLQRVARHLYRRGHSFEYRRVIPVSARHLFGDVATYSRSFGDVTRREADHLAAEHRKHCDKLISMASNTPDPTARAVALKFRDHTPSFEEIDQAVRSWVSEQERQLSRIDDPKLVKPTVQAMDLIAELTPVHQRADRQGSLLQSKWIADAIAIRAGWSISADTPELRHLLNRVGRAQREVAVRVRAELNFDDRPQPTHSMFDPVEFLRDEDRPIASSQYFPIMDVFDRYAAEQQPAPKTLKKWSAALRSLIDHLGHDDVQKITADDIVRWKDTLLSPAKNGGKARGQGTVRNGYLGGIKPVFQWAVNNRIIPINPVAGVKVSVPRRIRTRSERGFTDAEANVVLAAASRVNWKGEGTYTAFACRWLPWLCAYSGARVGEMAQLRRTDIRQAVEGIWYLTITPEAGSQKGGYVRQIAIHPHLIEQGFIAAIEGRRGPLFYDPARRREGSAGNPQYVKVGERVAKWVRSLGITDKELQPNHGWRHRFTTIARQIRMDADVRRAILGHAAKDEHQEYGDVLIQLSYKWICEIPRYTIER